ncbi:MAG: VCBS repeat-containing protein, partial [Pseudomonadota bacterium]|nr:VCBS repeat-containing protein [Pseudomonadota bacterium]
DTSDGQAEAGDDPSQSEDMSTQSMDGSVAADSDLAGADVPMVPRSDRPTFDAYTDLIVDNPVKRRYGIAITDFDNDGDFEAIVTGYGGANEVLDYRQGQLVDITPVSLRDEGRRAIGVAACDITGDGREEIYFLNVDRFGGLGEVSDRLYRRSGTEWDDLFELEANSSAINRFAGRSVACLDRNGDGQYGVFVANYGGPMKLFELGAGDRLVDRGPEAGIDLTTGGRSLIVLPGENGLDLFAGNERGANFYFANQGEGAFAEEAGPRGVADAFETVRGVAMIDANRDGLLDLVYGNWEGPHRLFLRQPDGTFRNAAPPAMAAPSRIRTVIAADFDNDGTEELFWNNIGQPNRLFKYDEGTWVPADIGDALEPDGLGTGAAIVDLDEDGVLELLVAHGESGAQPLSLYR